MARALFILCLSVSVLQSFSQDYDRVYFDKTWRITAMDSATYVRTSSFDATKPAYDGEVVDYFLSTSKLAMSGRYENGLRQGEFKFFNEKGTLILSASYKDGSRTGTWREFYSNGSIKLECNYVGDVESIAAWNDSVGHPIQTTGKIKHEYWMATDGGPEYGRDRIGMKGEMKGGLREGKWIVSKDGTPYATINYKAGVLEKGIVQIGGVHQKLLPSLLFPIIIEPDQLYITERFVTTPGERIKNNYVVEGLYKHEMASEKKKVVKNRSDLANHISTFFDVRSKSAPKTIIIKINTRDGVMTDFTTSPALSNALTRDLGLVLSMIANFEFAPNDSITVEYQVEQDSGK